MLHDNYFYRKPQHPGPLGTLCCAFHYLQHIHRQTYPAALTSRLGGLWENSKRVKEFVGGPKFAQPQVVVICKLGSVRIRICTPMALRGQAICCGRVCCATHDQIAECKNITQKLAGGYTRVYFITEIDSHGCLAFTRSFVPCLHVIFHS